MSSLAQNAIFQQTALITVPFHGNNLFIVNLNNEPYTPMKPIVEGMGLDWAAQFTKLKQRFASCIAEITIQLPSDTQQRAMTCLPIRKLFGWLNSISPNKVNPEIRDTVIMYQNECDDALYAYWTKGVAINPRITITPEQKAVLHAIVDRRVNGFNSLRAGLWKRHNKHFSVNCYHELLASRFDDAVAYLETVELKYPTPKNKLNDGYHFFVVKDGVPIYQKVINGDSSSITPAMINNQPILLEHIKQVIGEFIGKTSLPHPKNNDSLLEVMQSVEMMQGDVDYWQVRDALKVLVFLLENHASYSQSRPMLILLEAVERMMVRLWTMINDANFLALMLQGSAKNNKPLTIRDMDTVSKIISMLGRNLMTLQIPKYHPL